MPKLARVPLREHLLKIMVILMAVMLRTATAPVVLPSRQDDDERDGADNEYFG